MKEANQEFFEKLGELLKVVNKEECDISLPFSIVSKDEPYSLNGVILALDFNPLDKCLEARRSLEDIFFKNNVCTVTTDSEIPDNDAPFFNMEDRTTEYIEGTD